ncbi:hypothetical protein, partial [Mogibacterium timidum]
YLKIQAFTSPIFILYGGNRYKSAFFTVVAKRLRAISERDNEKRCFNRITSFRFRSISKYI